ncbi:GPW/gp25 family protein [Streptomyces longispororuber]|uniref:GPW/gp25 family protein n=1 Tax=Streptomyces longispororuber TaxID=68230 RepID=UPI0021099AA1|nr:GPW/gp25 family protein [Streptomyces longispororuber]MCQ4211105.1 GPW/gp25 family protein [Streptomyces longispororuber]
MSTHPDQARTHLDFPFRIDPRGRSADTTDEGHVRDLIEQLLFTVPGERVNRPDFGSGALQLVFAPADQELAGAVEYSLQAALQRWLGDVIQVERVQVESEDSELRITVGYVLLATGDPGTAVLERETGP